MGTNLKKKDFTDILKNYSLGEYKNHKKLWWSIKNTLYLIETEKGKYILKLYEYSSKKEIKKIYSILEKLKYKNIPLAKTYLTNDNNLIVEKYKPLVIQEYVSGKEIKDANKSFVVDFARTLGKIDRELLKIKPIKKTLSKRFKPSDYRSDSVVAGFNFDIKEKVLLKELNKEVDKAKLRRTLIHGDFQLNNLLVEKNKIKAVIDWDDMHEGLLVDEIAVALNHLFFTMGKTDKKYLSDFFKEYGKFVKLTINEKKAIYFLIKTRMLGGIVWCDLSRKEHKDKYKKLTMWLNETIKSYNQFDEISLDEFLEKIKH